jgi:hypothetical protein
MERFKCGSIVLLNNDNGNFVSRAVRFFTNSTISHTDFTMGRIVEEEATLSAEPLISVLPLVTYFHDEGFEFKVYEIQGVPEVVLDKWVTGMFLDYAGTTYGFLQLLWFIYRWAMEKLGKDVRKGKNWFPQNKVCSEMVYNLMLKVGLYYRSDLKKKLDEWNENTVTPEDIKRVVEAFPAIFKLKLKCNRGTITFPS